MFYKISKKIRKKIRQYHKRDLKIFIGLLLMGILFLILAIITTVVVIYFNVVSIEIFYVIIGMVFLFTFMAPSSVIFLMKYFTNVVLTKELFNNKRILIQLIDELKTNHNDDYISDFQKVSRRFISDFHYLYWGYFKKYKKRIKTSNISFGNYYIDFERIIHLLSINVEIRSEKTKKLLNDFSRYLEDIEKKILIPILDGEIQSNDVKNFFGRWIKYFKDNYKKKYQESSKCLDEHIEIQRKKYRKRSQRISKIIEGITISVIAGIIIIIMQYIISINLF